MEEVNIDFNVEDFLPIDVVCNISVEQPDIINTELIMEVENE